MPWRQLVAIIAFVLATCFSAQVPSGYPLAEGQQLRFQLTLGYTQGGVTVGMCDRATSCSAVTVLGVAHGHMGKRWNETCTTNCISDCRVQTTVDGSYGWRYNDKVIFVARRETQRLTVWVDGHPEQQVDVSIQPGQNEFKFISFIGSVVLLDIPGRVTDGYQMAVGEQVSVLFNATEGRFSIPCIGLCGAERCTQMMVLGVEGTQLGYYVGTTRYNVPGNKWSSITERVDKPNEMPLGHYWFEVHRRSETEVEMWLRDNPEWKVQIETSDCELRTWTDTFYPIFTTNPRAWAQVAIFTNESN